MKKNLFLFYLILSFLLMFKVTSFASDSDFNEINYKDLDLEGYSTVIDTYVLKDGSYFMLSASKELFDEYQKINNYSSTRIKKVNYYLTKYNSNQELEVQQLIDSCEFETNMCLSHEVYSHMIALDEYNLILANQTKVFNYNYMLETLTEIDMDGLVIEINDLIKIDNAYIKNGFIIVGQGQGYHQTAIRETATIALFNQEKLQWVNHIEGLNGRFFTALQYANYYLIVSGERFKASTPGEIYGSGRTVSMLAKFDLSGHLYWMKETEQTTYKMIKMQDGNALLAGTTRKKFGISTDDNPASVASIEKINPHTGESIWKGDYSTQGPYTYILTDVIETNNEEILATGKIMNFATDSDFLYVGKQFIFGMDNLGLREERPGIIVKFDNKGTGQWVSKMDNLVMYQMNSLPNGQILLTGNRYAEGFYEKLTDYDNTNRQSLWYNPELYGVTSILSIDEINHSDIELPSQTNPNLIYLIPIVTVFSIIGIIVIIYNKKSKRTQSTELKSPSDN